MPDFIYEHRPLITNRLANSVKARATEACKRAEGLSSQKGATVWRIAASFASKPYLAEPLDSCPRSLPSAWKSRPGKRHEWVRVHNTAQNREGVFVMLTFTNDPIHCKAEPLCRGAVILAENQNRTPAAGFGMVAESYHNRSTRKRRRYRRTIPA